MLVAGCDSTDPPSANLADRPGELPSKQEVLARVAPHTLDGFLLSIAQAAPGFAGVYIEDGVLQVAVAEARLDGRGVATSKNETYAAAVSALRVLAPDLFEEYEVATSPRMALYAFDDVTYWRHALADVAEGLWLTDSDERRGVAVLRFATEADVATTHGLAASLGIPERAVDIAVGRELKRTQSSENQSNLFRGSVDYVEGGDAIAVSTQGCTYGAMVYRGETSGSPAGFITNSHCTNGAGLIGGLQGLSANHSGELLGVESSIAGAVDPEFHDAPVSSIPKSGSSSFLVPGYTRPFRYSDAAFIDFDLGNVVPLFGRIVRTAMPGTSGPGSPSRVGAFEIVENADAQHHLLGAEVHKMGVETHRTVGAIGNASGSGGSCFDYIFLPTRPDGSPDPNDGDMLVCQHRVQAHADQGDSGSPVFVLLDELEKSSSQPSVRFQGLLWIENDTNYVYSPYGGINQDLKAPGGYGALVTH